MDAAVVAEAPAARVGAGVADDDGEQFDVVDAENRVVGQAARRVVHRDGLLHRVAHVLVLRASAARAELLLQRRSPRKRIGPGRVDLSCAEHLTAGETPKDAAVRGLREELGLRIQPQRLVEVRPPLLRYMSYEDVGHYDNEFVSLYAVEYRDEDGDPQPDYNEVVDVFWRSVEDVMKMRRGDDAKDLSPWFFEELATTDLRDAAKRVCNSGDEDTI